MAQPILLKRSAVQGNIPTTANLALGELAMNTYDGKLFMRKDNGSPSIIELTSAGSISNVPAGSITSTTVQAAINELDTKKISKTAASYIQSTGLNTSWGVTNGVNTGAFNAIMGSDASATWLLSGTSNGVFRSGIQSLDSDGSLRFYSGSNYFQFLGNTLSATNFSGNGSSITNVNATSLSGVTATTGNTANTIAIRDVNGKISASSFAGVNLTNNTVAYNLGTPTVEEMALVHGEMNNKFRFISPTIQEESTDGTTWTASTRLSANNLGDMMIGEGQGISPLQAIIPANSTNSWRITWDSNALNQYIFLNKFYTYISTNGNTITILIEEQDASDSLWYPVTSGSVYTWPGHVYIPHTRIAYQPTASTSDKSKAVRVTFNSTNASIGANTVQIGNIEWFGGYPTGRRNVESYDRNKNVTFPGNISGNYINGTIITSSIATGTPPLTVASTTKVTNLNADLLDGLDSTAFQPTLISGTNIRTINGNSLLGSTDLVISGSVPLSDDTSTDATMYPVFATDVSGNMTGKTSSTKLTFNPSTGSLKSSNIGGNVVTTNYSSTYSNSIVTSSVSNTTLLSQPITSFYSFDLIVQAIESSNFHTTKLLIVQDGTNAYISESNTIQNNIPLGIYDANIINGNIVISVTPTSTKSTLFNFSCVMLSKTALIDVAGSTTPSGPIGGSGVSTFNALTDAPSSYVGQGGKLVRVKEDESGLEFYYPSIGTNTITYTAGSEAGVIDLRTLVGIAYKVTLDITSITGTCTMKFINSSGTLTEDFTSDTTKTIYDTDFTHNIDMDGTCTINISVYYKL